MTTEFPPQLMDAMITAAIAHRRNFKVSHPDAAAGAAAQHVEFRAFWRPAGCEIATEVIARWSVQDGALRLALIAARGYRRDWHRISGDQAMLLLTGDECYWRPYAPHPAA